MSDSENLSNQGKSIYEKLREGTQKQYEKLSNIMKRSLGEDRKRVNEAKSKL